MWMLEGYDTFDGEWYPVGEEDGYGTPQEALLDAQKRLADLERTQPTASSGGQGIYGIQDQVYLVHPDGRRERVFRAVRS